MQPLTHAHLQFPDCCSRSSIWPMRIWTVNSLQNWRICVRSGAQLGHTGGFLWYLCACAMWFPAFRVKLIMLSTSVTFWNVWGGTFGANDLNCGMLATEFSNITTCWPGAIGNAQVSCLQQHSLHSTIPLLAWFVSMWLLFFPKMKFGLWVSAAAIAIFPWWNSTYASTRSNQRLEVTKYKYCVTVLRWIFQISVRNLSAYFSDNFLLLLFTF